MAHLTRATGRQETEQMLGQIVGQYRRLVSTTSVRAQAMNLLARIPLITPAAKDAAGRREVAMRLETEMRRERKAQEGQLPHYAVNLQLPHHNLLPSD